MKRGFTKKYYIGLVLGLALLFTSSVLGMAMAEESKIQIVTTIFPVYDWVWEITEGDDAIELTMLLDSGVDLHSYQPSAADIMRVASCDLFIYVGGESDEWVEDVLQEAVNPDMKVINLLEYLGDDVKIEETVEGMEPEDEEGEDEEEADEHIWLSLRNAQKLVRSIADVLSQIDPDHASQYTENVESYIANLAELDQFFTDMVEKSEYRTILFGDRFPFRYLADDYGLAYYAAFSGCSAETEASFKTILFLAQKLDELGLPAVLTIDGSDQKIAKTIVNTTRTQNQKILTLDSMQGTTAIDVKAGATYLAIMQRNLEVLTEALN